MTKKTTTATTAPHAAKPGAKKPAAKKAPAKKAAAKPKTSTPQSGSSRPGSPDLNSVLQQYGISPSGGGTGELDDLYGNGESVVRGYDIYITRSSAFVGQHGTQRSKIKASELFDSLNTMDGAQYRKLQERLFAGGFYGTADKRGIAFGDRYDPDTREALARAIARNVLANRTTVKDKRITLDGILDDAAANAPAALQDQGSQRAPFSYQPPDPAALKQALDKAVPTLIGKALSPEEAEMLTAEIQQHLEAAARSAYGVQETGGVAAPEFEAGAYIERRAQELHPTEFGAMRLADLSEQFLNAIRGDQQPMDRVF